MTRRIVQFALLAALALGVFVQESSAAITYRIENVLLVQGDTSGTFNIFIDATAPDLGLLIASFNLSAGVGAGGTVGGGPAGVLLGTPVQAASNPLIAAGPVFPMMTPPTTTAFRLTVQDPTMPPGQPVDPPPTHTLVTVPFTLAAPALNGQVTPLVFNDPNSPFNNYTQSNNEMLNVSSLVNGSITVTAVPEPASAFALGALFVAGGVRQYRKRRKTA